MHPNIGAPSALVQRKSADYQKDHRRHQRIRAPESQRGLNGESKRKEFRHVHGTGGKGEQRHPAEQANEPQESRLSAAIFILLAGKCVIDLHVRETLSNNNQSLANNG